MTGPEHYREAGRLLQSARDAAQSALLDQSANLTARAAVHAQLAAVAVSVTTAAVLPLGSPAVGLTEPENEAWDAAGAFS